MEADAAEVPAIEQHLRKSRKERREAFTRAQDHAVRLGKIVTATDPDSPDVKELGYVPKSERKHPARKAKVG